MTLDVLKLIHQMSRVFPNGLGDWGSIQDQVILKTQEMVLDSALLNIQHFMIRIKWRNPGNGVAPSPTSQSSSY